MKKLLMLALAGLFAFTGCQQPKPVKTIENLKAAIIGETTASAKYAAFAVKAQENHPEIAKLFEAVSKAEGIHAANHIKALESLGEKMEEFTPEFEVKTTLENLQAAVQGETYETETMYPQFLADAAAEKVQKATQSFSWASDTEKIHLEFYKNAVTALLTKVGADSADKTSATEKTIAVASTLPAGYAVCPVCGNTYDSAAIDDKCAFCLTGKDQFINF